MRTSSGWIACVLLLVTANWVAAEVAPPKSPTSASAATPAPITKGQRLYAAHHSYFAAIPPILTEIAKAAGFPDQTFVGAKYIGGSKSIQHWNIKDEDNKAKDALKAGTTDVLILDPRSICPMMGSKSSRNSDSSIIRTSG